MSTSETFAARGYGAGSLSWGSHPVVLVVDFQRAFTKPVLPMGGGDHIVAAVHKAADVLAAARPAGIPVIHTAVAYDPGGHDLGLWNEKVPALREVTIGSEHAEVDPLLWDESDSLIVKKGPSAFFGTALAPMLTRYRCDTLLIMGATTSGCVRATIVDAFSHGFPPFIVTDACGDQDRTSHQANIDDCTRRYAEAIDAAEAVARIKA
ncbi:MAG: isochorismatase family protein [Actinomycetota bacterium]|nr:isochorismatase family protein [Actinomycetota bacterium]